MANYTQAIAQGQFASLETALQAAKECRATLQGELAHLDGEAGEARPVAA